MMGHFLGFENDVNIRIIMMVLLGEHMKTVVCMGMSTKELITVTCETKIL